MLQIDHDSNLDAIIYKAISVWYVHVFQKPSNIEAKKLCFFSSLICCLCFTCESCEMFPNDNKTRKIIRKRLFAKHIEKLWYNSQFSLFISKFPIRINNLTKFVLIMFHLIFKWVIIKYGDFSRNTTSWNEIFQELQQHFRFC